MRHLAPHVGIARTHETVMCRFFAPFQDRGPADRRVLFMPRMNVSLRRSAVPALRSAVLCLALAVWGGTRHLHAQKTGQTIGISRTAVLSGGRDGAYLQLGSPIVRDSRGRYFASGLTDPAKIVVYDSRGRPLSVIGKRGSGPGEFAGVQRLFVSPGDSLFAVDISHQVSVFSPEHRFVRSFRPQGLVRSMVFASKGRLILSLAMPLSGPALVLTDRNGRVVQHLGSPARNPQQRPNLVAAAGVDRVWAGVPNRYRLELLDASGKRHGTVARQLPWFGSDPSQKATRRERGSMRECAYDPATASLRVLLYRENSSFRPRARRPAGGAEGPITRLDAAQAQERFDVVLEVLDARTGRVIASANTDDRMIAGFISPTEVYSHREDRDGAAVVDVWRVRLLDTTLSRR